MQFKCINYTCKPGASRLFLQAERTRLKKRKGSGANPGLAGDKEEVPWVSHFFQVLSLGMKKHATGKGQKKRMQAVPDINRMAEE
jgi:hypothetical protein